MFVHAGRPEFRVGVNPKRFLGELTTAFDEGGPLDEPVRTAYDLFASSRFENSSRARFLLLVMAVEATLKRQRRPAEQITMLDGLLANAVSRASDQAWAAFLSGIRELKRESIGTTAVRQITSVLSTDAAEEFRNLYKLRSRLVHGGTPIEPSELNDASNKLERIVKALLLSRLTQSTT